MNWTWLLLITFGCLKLSVLALKHFLFNLILIFGCSVCIHLLKLNRCLSLAHFLPSSCDIIIAVTLSVLYSFSKPSPFPCCPECRTEIPPCVSPANTASYYSCVSSLSQCPPPRLTPRCLGRMTWTMRRWLRNDDGHTICSENSRTLWHKRSEMSSWNVCLSRRKRRRLWVVPGRSEWFTGSYDYGKQIKLVLCFVVVKKDYASDRQKIYKLSAIPDAFLKTLFKLIVLMKKISGFADIAEKYIKSLCKIPSLKPQNIKWSVPKTVLLDGPGIIILISLV